MPSPTYTPTGVPVQGSAGVSSEIRAEFTAIETGIELLNLYPMVAQFDDINTADQIYLVAPWACTVEKIYVVVNADNATADTVITAKIGGAAVTGGSGTILSTALAGSVLTITPTALNTLIEGGALEIETDGGGSGTVSAHITVVFKRT
jgi:hypothetical protein